MSVGTLRRFAAALAQHRLGGVSRGKRLMFGALFVAGLASAGAYALRSSGPAAPAKGGRGAAAATAAGAGAGAAVTLPPGTPLVVDDAYAIVRQVAHAPGDFAMAGAIRGGPEYVQGVLAAERLVFDRLLVGVQDPEARLGIVDAEVSRAFALRDPERLRTALEHVKLIDPHVQDARTMAALSRGHFALAKLLKGQGLAERQARVQGVLFGEQFKRVMQHPDGRAFHGAGWTPALAEQVRASLVSVMSTRASVAGHPREYAVGYLDGLNEAIKAYNAQYGLLRLRVGVRARR